MRKSLVSIVLIPFFAVLVLAGGSLTTAGAAGRLEMAEGRKTAGDPKCTDCHGEVIARKNVHAAAADACGNCHKTDIKEHTEKYVKGLQLSENLPDLCYQCHEEVKKDVEASKNIHQAVRTRKSCANCHNPHSSENEKLLAADEKKLCLSCHNKDVTATGGPAVNIKNLLATSKVVHPPVRDDGCVVCHKPHASGNNYLLINSFPTGNYVGADAAAFGICWECHDIDLFKEVKTTSATNFRNGDQNLHFIHLNSGTSRNCVMCHNVHGSPNAHLIEDKVKFGQWNLPIRYTPAENGGACFPGCHEKREYRR